MCGVVVPSPCASGCLSSRDSMVLLAWYSIAFTRLIRITTYSIVLRTVYRCRALHEIDQKVVSTHRHPARPVSVLRLSHPTEYRDVHVIDRCRCLVWQMSTSLARWLICAAPPTRRFVSQKKKNDLARFVRSKNNLKKQLPLLFSLSLFRTRYRYCTSTAWEG